jgi:gas vesicle protein
MTDDSMEQDEKEYPGEAGPGLGGFAAGIVFGVVLGAGLALLFAPERGETTRRELRRRLARLREDAETGLERAGKQTRRELARRRRQLEEGLERARDRR